MSATPHYYSLAAKADRTWGTFCQQCTDIFGNYVYPCRLSTADAPPAVLATAVDLSSPGLHDKLALAISDPGSVLPRERQPAETVTRWSTRAVLHTLRGMGAGQ